MLKYRTSGEQTYVTEKILLSCTIFIRILSLKRNHRNYPIWEKALNKTALGLSP